MKCPYCNSEWKPRIADPVQCPRCKRVLNPPTTRVVRLGKPEYAQKRKEAGIKPDRTCPECGGINTHQKGCKHQ